MICTGYKELYKKLEQSTTPNTYFYCVSFEFATDSFDGSFPESFSEIENMPPKYTETNTKIAAGSSVISVLDSTIWMCDETGNFVQFGG